MKNILLIGPGAVGSLCGAGLLKAESLDFRVLADDARIQRYRRTGHYLNGELLPYCYQTLDELGSWCPDLILIATKSNGLRQLPQLMQLCVEKRHTVILPLLNGISSPFFLKKLFPENPVLQGFFLGHASYREENRITHIVTESKSGAEAWAAKRFIDCTGDGDLGALAGCSFEFGGPDGNTQPSSFIGIVCGLDPVAVQDFLAPHGGKPRLKELMESHGIFPTYGMPSLFHFGQGIFGLMSNHGYKVNAIDADNLTAKVLEGRKELHAHVAFLRSLGGIWSNIALAGSSDNLGVREGRRLKGMEYVDWRHLGSGGRCDNAVCRATFCVDVHAPDPAKGNVIADQKVQTKPYDIPWGALVSAERENLLMAGRCISGDFIAHSSYRVTGDAVPMGEAAGIGAAISVRENILPSQVKGVPFFSVEQ